MFLGLVLVLVVPLPVVRYDVLLVSTRVVSEAVRVWKLGAWALLVSMSFVLVATVQAAEGRLYHVPGEPHVTADTTGLRGGGPPPARRSRSGPRPPARR